MTRRIHSIKVELMALLQIILKRKVKYIYYNFKIRHDIYIKVFATEPSILV